MDEITCVVQGVRVTLRPGEVLLWADREDTCPDPDVAIHLDALLEVLDLAMYLREGDEEDPHA